MNYDVNTATTQQQAKLDGATDLLATSAAGREPRGELTFICGARVGRYVIQERLGAGAMGVVYCARDPELDRKVALKFLKSGEGDLAARGRLIREAQAMAKLAHPNVVTVHDVGTFGDEVFVAMEFVDGITLTQWLRDCQRDWQAVVAVFVAVGHGLAAAHKAGLVHRDLKPENIMIGVDGRVRVMDFGLARASSRAGETGHFGYDLDGQALAIELTRTGSLLGTPPYMAPEQWEGGEANAHSDQFSFCVALWEAVYGERPFRAPTLPALMQAITQGTRPPPSDPRRAPAWLRQLIDRGLSVDAAARWPSMPILLTELTRHPQATRRSGTWPAIAVGGFVFAAALTAWLVLGPPARADPELSLFTIALGECYRIGERHYSEGSYELAISIFKKVYELNSEETSLLYNIANAYERLGDFENARHYLGEYLRLAPETEHAALELRIQALERRQQGAAAKAPGPEGAASAGQI